MSKSSTSATTAFLLAEKGYKVLAIDMDSQANSYILPWCNIKKAWSCPRKPSALPFLY
ncbi:AAA family ATPase [Paucisalibacillus sp. EB02]|uniref:ParA family protein n=1 Tax=Paucisalibacillus sp. EB02 TaxID=1347087 RepID=UPI0004B1E9DB